MNGLTVVRSPSMTQRRQPLLAPEGGLMNKNRKFGEMAGETAAECAAVWCCCPCAVMNLVVLAVYKVPAGLCRKAWSKQRKRQRIARRKQVGGLLIGPNVGSLLDHGGQTEELLEAANTEENEKFFELEKEMWNQFHGAGFWRSPSQKDKEVHPHAL